MEDQPAMGLDSTVRSQDSSNSKDSKVSKLSKETNISRISKDSKAESKHSKDVLISEKNRHQHSPQHLREQENRQHRTQVKDDTNILMFTSCGQLLLGVVLVVFGILVLVHGAALGGTGAGLWAGASALVSGALGVVATLANKSSSGFSTAHLASSLVALALSNMSAITALASIVRDSQRSEFTLLAVPGEEDHVVEFEDGWSRLLASIGLLIASVGDLLVSGYICVTLTPKLCGCLKSNPDDETDGRLKTRNMVHQWVIAQNHVPKSHQPIYVVQSVMPMHPIIQHPYGMHPPPGKYPTGFVQAGTLPLAAPGYGAMPILPHMGYPSRPPSQMMRTRTKRYSSEEEDGTERRRHSENKSESSKKMTSIGEDQVDLAQTYTGLDKRISEEFISIAMDPTSHHGSEIGSGAVNINNNIH